MLEGEHNGYEADLGSATTCDTDLLMGTFPRSTILLDLGSTSNSIRLHFFCPSSTTYLDQT